MVARASAETKPGLEELIAALRNAWSADTSVAPDQWTPSTPSQGQCAVTALVLQDYLGGELRRGLVDGLSHYWLTTDSGKEVDLTLNQFRNPTVTLTGVRERDYLLSSVSTRRRYKLLANSVARQIREHAQD
ncbi:YunG family protein [Propionibacterium cyclohexanicum]|uniref:YunG family protein n=1 Tax=Propionibacterium cyclohexanicum TaxID=64702 RepID=UPI003CCBD01C